jgi:hypothetical protein
LETSIEVGLLSKARKLYATTSNLNTHVNHLFEKAGFKKEALFPDHYKIGSNEIIWGKHLVTPSEIEDININSAFESEDSLHGINIEKFDQTVFNFLSESNQIYSQWHDDLGEDFLNGMINGTERDLSFQEKGKIILIAKCLDKPVGTLTFTPKRGGPVKIYPLRGNLSGLFYLLEECKKIAKSYCNHKFYTFVHKNDTSLLEFLINYGFEPRGLIESPYKNGHDLIPLDIFIK